MNFYSTFPQYQKLAQSTLQTKKYKHTDIIIVVVSKQRVHSVLLLRKRMPSTQTQSLQLSNTTKISIFSVLYISLTASWQFLGQQLLSPEDFMLEGNFKCVWPTLPRALWFLAFTIFVKESLFLRIATLLSIWHFYNAMFFHIHWNTCYSTKHWWYAFEGG